MRRTDTQFMEEVIKDIRASKPLKEPENIEDVINKAIDKKIDQVKKELKAEPIKPSEENIEEADDQVQEVQPTVEENEE